MSGERVFRASAPVRLDFAGGWTDVAPFATEERGVVVSAAIELRARAEVELGGDRHILHSADLGKSATLGSGPDELQLLRVAVRRSGLGACSVRTRSDVPAGSGLGSSGAMGVALVAALDAARGARRGPLELAEEAFQLEAVEAALPGGKQDQYAAALGGFNRMSFACENVVVERLEPDPTFAAELEQHLVLCYTGTSRVSSNTISRVMNAYARRDREVVEALRRIAEIAERMADAVRSADLALVGRLLTMNWREQQRLDPGMCTDEMARLESAMASAGALGGKAAGAGAGGSMFFIAADPKRATQAAEAAGARLLPFRWARQGVTVS